MRRKSVKGFVQIFTGILVIFISCNACGTPKELPEQPEIHSGGEGADEILLEDRNGTATEESDDGNKGSVGEEPAPLTDFEQALQSGKGSGEIIYQWSLTGTSAYYHPYDEGYEGDGVDTFIAKYLQNQGFGGQVPEEVLYQPSGERFLEYYVDEEEQSICFILHLWAEYWLDFQAGTSKYQDAVYCETFCFDDAKIEGSLFCHKEGDSIQETQYDECGMRVADVTYQYQEGVPFPFVTACWNLNDGIWLCRNQKTWFYEEEAKFDQEGKFISSDESGWKKGDKFYFQYPCYCIYGENGRLEAIREELQPEDKERGWGWWDDSIDYSGQMEFGYSKEGILQTVTYLRSSYTHGTADSSGTIEYDEQGRMVYNYYYMTHGEDRSIYLYRGNEENPWAILDWCCYGPGFETVTLFEKIP